MAREHDGVEWRTANDEDLSLYPGTFAAGRLEDMCNRTGPVPAEDGGFGTYYCTRKRGHEGPHIAHTGETNIVAVEVHAGEEIT